MKRAAIKRGRHVGLAKSPRYFNRREDAGFFLTAKVR
jgi:hypothetical protein